jgi:hypothetical protein
MTDNMDRYVAALRVEVNKHDYIFSIQLAVLSSQVPSRIKNHVGLKNMKFVNRHFVFS